MKSMEKRNGKFGLNEISKLVESLTYHICSSLEREDCRKAAKYVCKDIFKSLNSHERYDSFEEDELVLTTSIESQLNRLNRAKDVMRFRFLNRRLQQQEFSSILTNKQAVLSFFLHLSENRLRENAVPQSIRNILSSSNNHLFPTSVSSSPSLKGAGDNSDPFFLSQNGDTLGLSNHSATRPTSLTNNIFIKRDAVSKTPPKPIFVQPARNGTSPSYKSASYDSLSHLYSPNQFSSKYKTNEVSESTIINELLFCFQGIEGSLLKLDHNGGFSIDPQVRVPQKQTVEALMELGFLHNSVKNQLKNLEKGGTIAKAIHTVVWNNLLDYYGLIGSLHCIATESSRKTKDDTPLSEEGSDDGPLTLRRLYSLTLQPMYNLKTIYEVLSVLRNNRGVFPTTALDILRHHGDERYSSMVTSIIVHAGRPIINMIINWMVEGELLDPMNEFFITINTNCQEKDIWRDKFILRQDMIPNVMSEEQAQMILRSGKAIHFLNVICGKQTPITGSRERLHKMKDVNILDLCDPRSELTQTIGAIFMETSKQVLDTLVNQFKLFQHFQGLRRYILLGQGDFVNYYMELVEPEMRKPAAELQFHRLMSLKSEAERATLAHYEDPEILNRVSVKVLVSSGGDWGSDVFGLQYLMHEPLDAALKLSEGAYSHMFNFLWRTKRMEYILLRLRKERWAIKNILNWLAQRVPDLKGVLVLADRLSFELFHFAREFHYYILFEVVECLWEKFSVNFSKAKSFDNVIESHDQFIKEMQEKTFQGELSRTFINELRLIWNLVFELESLEMSFFHQVTKEHKLRKDRDLYIEQNGTCEELEVEIHESDQKLKSFLSNMRAGYIIINNNYQDVLKKFLLELSSTKNHELRLLSSRIDYNEYYKGLDARLTESMKYSRCSDLFT